MELYLLALLVVFLCLVGLHFCIVLSRKQRLTKDIPGPPALPVIGNLLNVQVPFEKLDAVFSGWAKEYSPVYKLWFLNSVLFIFIHHPDDVEIMLTSSKNVNKGYVYDYFQPWLKSGLLVSLMQKWHKRRKILTPAFHFNILKKYMEITNEVGNKIIDNTTSEGEEIEIELMSYCSDCTLDIICESAMGIPLNGDLGKESTTKYKDAIYRIGNVIFQRIIKPYITNWNMPLFRALYNEQKDALKHLNDFTNKIVEERREYHENNNYKDVINLKEDDESAQENIYLGKKRRLAMLDLLLSAERDGLIDDEGIKEEVATFVFEGHDTTAMGMCFTIMLLAENKDAQDKAREEVVEILSRKNGALEIADLQGMHYLERCIKESLRLYPPVPMITRRITEDVQLKHCFAPRDTDVVIRFMDVHRNPEFWPEPEKFDPDRFLPDRMRQRHQFSYLPFSAGSRNCIGQKFAMMELKSLISRILYNFYLEPIDRSRDITIVTDIVTRPDRPIRTKFIKINRNIL